MEINVVGITILTAIVISVSLLLVTEMGQDLRATLPDKIQDAFSNIGQSISGVKSYDVCKAYSGKSISIKEFQTILQAAYNGECSSSRATYSLSFSLTKDDIKAMCEQSNIANNGEMVIYKKRTEPLGAGAIIIDGNAGTYPLKKYDSVELWSEGEPKKDVLISLKEEGCDPYDEDCDEMCSFLEGVCDPLCYLDQKSEDVFCDLDCVDITGDKNISEEDADGVCDLDCYNNITNPSRAYDIDCIFQNNGLYDDVCDPDTNGAKDGVCDPDCGKQNYICDFDCDGITDQAKNPMGLNDSDCYECDKVCSGFCSIACKEEDKDPDCLGGFEGFSALTECCGNKVCGGTENCEKCLLDCPGSNLSCEDLDRVCCPDSYDSEGYGCSNSTGKNATESCTCSNQCNENLTCTMNHCCPLGTLWSESGQNCTDKFDVLIVALKGRLDEVYSESQIKQLEDKIEEYRQALMADGLGSIFLYLDENETAEINPGGARVTNLGNSGNIDGVLNTLIPKLEAKYLVIIGGYNRFVQVSFGSSTGSDVPYSDWDGDKIMDVSVGRFPDPNNGDLAVILTALDTSINLHNSGGLVLSSHIAPIMSCGGIDNRNWNSGRCFCSAAFGSSCQACGSCCGNIGIGSTSGKDFVMVLAHGPGPASYDLLSGGGIDISNLPSNLDVSGAVWMTMSCGGGHLMKKATTGASIAMTFLKMGGAVYFGSTDLNYGNLGGNCPVLGGDNNIGSLYSEIATRFDTYADTQKRIGDFYREGKVHYYSSGDYGGSLITYHYGINCLYGDPTLKIKTIW